MATVHTLGTATRMFSNESASLSGISIWMGSSDRYAYSWSTGQTNAPPPEMQRALPSPPTFPEITSTRFAGQRRYREANRTSSPTTTTAASAAPMMVASGSPLTSMGPWMRSAGLSTSMGNLVQQEGVSDHHERIGTVHIYDEDGRPGRQCHFVSDGATLDEPTLNSDVHLSRAFAPTGDGEVHRSRTPNRRHQRKRRIPLEPAKCANDCGDTDHCRDAGRDGRYGRDHGTEGGRGESNDTEECNAGGDRSDTQQVEPFTRGIPEVAIVRVAILEADEAGHQLEQQHDATDYGAPQVKGRHGAFRRGTDPRSGGVMSCARHYTEREALMCRKPQLRTGRPAQPGAGTPAGGWQVDASAGTTCDEGLHGHPASDDGEWDRGQRGERCAGGELTDGLWTCRSTRKRTTPRSSGGGRSEVGSERSSSAWPMAS